MILLIINIAILIAGAMLRDVVLGGLGIAGVLFSISAITMDHQRNESIVA
jgi:hypothetical protein